MGFRLLSECQFVYTRELSGQRDVLAVTMTAAAMGRSVVFRGTCDPDGIYFYLLVTPLNRALALDERQHRAVVIAEQLHFDVAGRLMRRSR